MMVLSYSTNHRELINLCICSIVSGRHSITSCPTEIILAFPHPIYFAQKVKITILCIVLQSYIVVSKTLSLYLGNQQQICTDATLTRLYRRLWQYKIISNLNHNSVILHIALPCANNNICFEIT